MECSFSFPVKITQDQLIDLVYVAKQEFSEGIMSRYMQDYVGINPEFIPGDIMQEIEKEVLTKILEYWY